eukprot:GFUD01010514.1.p1 GENE.GFUD01010514.1~~GFUD01010514.1.p1  ORF type:complete len:242 (-),score=62.12 GFUD01010514.1:691-1416(-)
MMNARILLLLFCQHFSILVCSQLRVRESGVSYNQSVDYDPLTADVISHVPEHERDGILFRETIKIENVFLGMSVWREGYDEHCYFRLLMKYESPLVLSRIVETAEARNEVVDSSSMIQVLVWASLESDMTELEREELSTDMNKLCAGVPIKKMKTERLEMEEFRNKMETAGDCYTGHTALKDGKQKRNARRLAATCSNCAKSHGSSPPPAFARFSKRSVNTGFGTSQLVHLIIGHERLDCV